MNGGDIGMVQRCQGDGFPLKPGDSVGITAEFTGKDLDCDIALQLRVASSVDIAHPARTQMRLQFIGSELLSNELAGLRSADFATVRGRRRRRQATRPSAARDGTRDETRDERRDEVKGEAKFRI